MDKAGNPGALSLSPQSLRPNEEKNRRTNDTSEQVLVIAIWVCPQKWVWCLEIVMRARLTYEQRHFGLLCMEQSYAVFTPT